MMLGIESNDGNEDCHGDGKESKDENDRERFFISLCVFIMY